METASAVWAKYQERKGKDRRGFQELLLRKLCYSLVHDKGFPTELERVVCDLWALRLQLVDGKQMGLSEPEPESRMYSSQTELSETDDGPAERLGRKEKDMPTLIDILGLCYIEMFTAVQHIASVLTYPFTFPASKFRQQFSALPEVQLLALVVVAVKLYHPFDPLERFPKSLSDIGCLTIDWDLWQNEQAALAKKIKGNKPFPAGSEINVREHDVFNMTDLQIDTYLDWYEKTWIDPEEKERNYRSLPQDLLDMFPTGRLNGSKAPPVTNLAEELKLSQDAHTQKLIAVQKGLKMREVVSEAREGKQTHPVRRLGAMYACYRHVTDFPPLAKVFYEVAATVVAVSLPTLVTAVYLLEVKLQKWRKIQLRKEAEKSTTSEIVDPSSDEDVQDMELDTSVSGISDAREGEHEAHQD
ncbi:hypothetical protein MMC26_001477 [Xylographa opegraphella]|nr:hypothetical protein [Xylographa opegraphella]